jgi:hypothetical protein
MRPRLFLRLFLHLFLRRTPRRALPYHKLRSSGASG